MSQFIQTDPHVEACTSIVDEIGRRANEFVHGGALRFADNRTLIEANDIVQQVFRDKLDERPWITNRSDYAARFVFAKDVLKLHLSPFMEQVMARELQRRADNAH